MLGKTLKLLEIELNSYLFTHGYSISINPIVDQKEFWSLIRENQGKVEKLTFSYASPNLFGLKNKLSEDLKESSEKYGITNASISLENKKGALTIDENDELIKQSAEYTSRGGGEYKIKIKGYKTEKSSNDKVKTTTIDEIDLSANNPEELLKMYKNITEK